LQVFAAEASGIIPHFGADTLFRQAPRLSLQKSRSRTRRNFLGNKKS